MSIVLVDIAARFSPSLGLEGLGLGTHEGRCDLYVLCNETTVVIQTV